MMINKDIPMKDKRPYITINAAMTADGKIDTFKRDGAQISSRDDWKRVDRLRADHDAIMIGGRTLLGEDPRLTVKSSALQTDRINRGLDADPVKVGIVSEANLAPDSRFINHGSGRVVIITTNQTSSEKIEQLSKQGVEVHISGVQKVDLPNAMAMLRQQFGIKRLLVEGGGTLNSALIRLGLVDEIHLYIAPMIFGGAEAPTLADGAGLTLKNAVQLEIQSLERLDDGGVILRYRIQK
jgi:2,5-diamino-6-(ribosylamino)-4(3H)-pyrimidinone 5'-phosphate reductase